MKLYHKIMTWYHGLLTNQEDYTAAGTAVYLHHWERYRYHKEKAR